jgi:hypothetical protein
VVPAQKKRSRVLQCFAGLREAKREALAARSERGGATGTAGTKRVSGCFALPEVSVLSLKDPLWGGCARDGTVTKEAAEQGADLAAGSPKRPSLAPQLYYKSLPGSRILATSRRRVEPLNSLAWRCRPSQQRRLRALKRTVLGRGGVVLWTHRRIQSPQGSARGAQNAQCRARGGSSTHRRGHAVARRGGSKPGRRGGPRGLTLTKEAYAEGGKAARPAAPDSARSSAARPLRAGGGGGGRCSGGCGGSG